MEGEDWTAKTAPIARGFFLGAPEEEKKKGTAFFLFVVVDDDVAFGALSLARALSLFAYLLSTRRFQAEGRV